MPYTDTYNMIRPWLRNKQNFSNLNYIATSSVIRGRISRKKPSSIVYGPWSRRNLPSSSFRNGTEVASAPISSPWVAPERSKSPLTTSCPWNLGCRWRTQEQQIIGLRYIQACSPRLNEFNHIWMSILARKINCDLAIFVFQLNCLPIPFFFQSL